MKAYTTKRITIAPTVTLGQATETTPIATARSPRHNSDDETDENIKSLLRWSCSVGRSDWSRCDAMAVRGRLVCCLCGVLDQVCALLVLVQRAPFTRRQTEGLAEGATEVGGVAEAPAPRDGGDRPPGRRAPGELAPTSLQPAYPDPFTQDDAGP